MSLEIFRDSDAHLHHIREKKVAIIGFGNQGHAHALNLKDHDVPVVVGLRENSCSWEKATSAGCSVLPISQAVQWANVIMLLTPDEVMAEIFTESVAPYLQAGDFLAFAHGFNIHYRFILPPENVGVFMVSPKGPGHMVRSHFQQGRGVPCLVATVDSDPETLQLALAYAKAIGGTRMAAIKTTFREETETDLFGEQAVLCGGFVALLAAGFNTLVAAGYSPAMAYLECVYEIKHIVKLIENTGFSGLSEAISNTAEYGGYLAGEELIDQQVNQKMQKILTRIQDGTFADQWMQEHRQNSPRLKHERQKISGQLLEKVSQDIRHQIFTAKGENQP